MSPAAPSPTAPELRAELNALFARLADGDRAAIDPAYRALWPVVHPFVGRALGPGRTHEADDVTQSALLKLFDQAPRYDTGRDALAWALTIAGWEVRTWRTRSRRSRTGPLQPALAHVSADTSPEEQVLAAAERQQLADAIAQLPQRDQEVLAQVLADEHLSDATFRKRRERAMGRLRAFLRDVHGT